MNSSYLFLTYWLKKILISSSAICITFSYHKYMLRKNKYLSSCFVWFQKLFNQNFTKNVVILKSLKLHRHVMSQKIRMYCVCKRKMLKPIKYLWPDKEVLATFGHEILCMDVCTIGIWCWRYRKWQAALGTGLIS